MTARRSFCGQEALDRYLQQQARQDAERRVAAAFVLTEPPVVRVMGHYTRSAGVIDLQELPAAIAGKLPRNPQLPVTLLGHLAVGRAVRGA